MFAAALATGTGGARRVPGCKQHTTTCTCPLPPGPITRTCGAHGSSKIHAAGVLSARQTPIPDDLPRPARRSGRHVGRCGCGEDAAASGALAGAAGPGRRAVAGQRRERAAVLTPPPPPPPPRRRAAHHDAAGRVCAAPAGSGRGRPRCGAGTAARAPRAGRAVAAAAAPWAQHSTHGRGAPHTPTPLHTRSPRPRRCRWPTSPPPRRTASGRPAPTRSCSSAPPTPPLRPRAPAAAAARPRAPAPSHAHPPPRARAPPAGTATSRGTRRTARRSPPSSPPATPTRWRLTTLWSPRVGARRSRGLNRAGCELGVRPPATAGAGHRRRRRRRPSAPPRPRPQPAGVSHGIDLCCRSWRRRGTRSSWSGRRTFCSRPSWTRRAGCRRLGRGRSARRLAAAARWRQRADACAGAKPGCAHAAAAQNHLKTVDMPTDADGVDTDALEALLASGSCRCSGRARARAARPCGAPVQGVCSSKPPAALSRTGRGCCAPCRSTPTRAARRCRLRGGARSSRSRTATVST